MSGSGSRRRASSWLKHLRLGRLEPAAAVLARPGRRRQALGRRPLEPGLHVRVVPGRPAPAPVAARFAEHEALDRLGRVGVEPGAELGAERLDARHGGVLSSRRAGGEAADSSAKFPPMRVLLANPRGFCAGVDRAIEIVELALERYGPPIYVRHEIVHNRHVVDGLRAKGAVFVDDPAEAPGRLAADLQRARRLAGGARRGPGAGPARDRRHLPAGDQGARRSRAHGARGHGHRAGRPQGTRGSGRHDGARAGAHAPGAIGRATWPRSRCAIPQRLGCVTQTTLSVDDTREILEALKRRFPAIRLPRKDDICYATQNRQNAVKELTERAEVVIVVGAPESSNSSRLVELADKRGARAHLVQTAAEIDPAWLGGRALRGRHGRRLGAGGAGRGRGRPARGARGRRGGGERAAPGRRGRHLPASRTTALSARGGRLPRDLDPLVAGHAGAGAGQRGRPGRHRDGRAARAATRSPRSATPRSSSISRRPCCSRSAPPASR